MQGIDEIIFTELRVIQAQLPEFRLTPAHQLPGAESQLGQDRDELGGVRRCFKIQDDFWIETIVLE